MHGFPCPSLGLWAGRREGPDQSPVCLGTDGSVVHPFKGMKQGLLDHRRSPGCWAHKSLTLFCGPCQHGWAAGCGHSPALSTGSGEEVVQPPPLLQHCPAACRALVCAWEPGFHQVLVCSCLPALALQGQAGPAAAGGGEHVARLLLQRSLSQHCCMLPPPFGAAWRRDVLPP